MARTLPPALAGAAIPEPQAEPQKPTADTVAADTVDGDDDDWGEDFTEEQLQDLRWQDVRMQCLRLAVDLQKGSTTDPLVIINGAALMTEYVMVGYVSVDGKPEGAPLGDE